MITTSPFYVEWQFYLYIIAVLATLTVIGKVGSKYFEHIQKIGKLLDKESELQEFLRNQLLSVVVLSSFLILIWIASGVFYFSYFFYVIAIGAGLTVVRRSFLIILGLDTQDMKRRRGVMSKLGASQWGAGISAVMIILNFFFVCYLFYKVISLRYAPVSAEEARLEMLLWVFGGEALFGLLAILPVLGLTMLRPALDPYVRFEQFLGSLFHIAGTVIALSLPYALFDPDVRANVRILPGDINSIYWLAGGFFVVFGSCFLIGTFAHSAQRREVLDKADAWLTEVEDAQRPGPKSHFRLERSANSVLDAPRMIGELISDDMYLTAFWLWRYPALRDGMKAFANETPSRNGKETEDDGPRNLSPAETSPAPHGAEEAEYDTPPRKTVRFQLPALIEGRENPHLDSQTITDRFRVEVKRSLGFLWGDKSPFYVTQVKSHGERFAADASALIRWNPRVRLLIGYTEIMQVLNQRERVLEIVEDLKTDIKDLRAERNNLLIRGLTMSGLGGGAVTAIIQIVKVLSSSH